MHVFLLCGFQGRVCKLHRFFCYFWPPDFYFEGRSRAPPCWSSVTLAAFTLFVSHTLGMAADSTMSNGQETASLNGEPVLKRSRDSVDSLRILREPQNKVTVVLGAQWGDEGKGKVVDLLAMDADIVCRCQVGIQALIVLCLWEFEQTLCLCRLRLELLHSLTEEKAETSTFRSRITNLTMKPKFPLFLSSLLIGGRTSDVTFPAARFFILSRYLRACL